MTANDVYRTVVVTDRPHAMSDMDIELAVELLKRAGVVFVGDQDDEELHMRISHLQENRRSLIKQVKALEERLERVGLWARDRYGAFMSDKRKRNKASRQYVIKNDNIYLLDQHEMKHRRNVWPRKYREAESC